MFVFFGYRLLPVLRYFVIFLILIIEANHCKRIERLILKSLILLSD